MCLDEWLLVGFKFICDNAAFPWAENFLFVDNFQVYKFALSVTVLVVVILMQTYVKAKLSLKVITMFVLKN